MRHTKVPGSVVAWPAPPYAALRLDVNSKYSSCFFLPMKNKHTEQPGSSSEEKRWLVIAAAKPHHPHQIPWDLQGKHQTDTQTSGTLGLGSLGPCPQPPSGSSVEHMGHFQAQNCTQAVLGFYSVVWVDITLVPASIAVDGAQTTGLVASITPVPAWVSQVPWQLWSDTSLPAHWCIRSATPAVWPWTGLLPSLGPSIHLDEPGMAYEVVVSWYVRRAAEGLRGLSAAHTKLFPPFPSQWALGPPWSVVLLGLPGSREDWVRSPHPSGKEPAASGQPQINGF